MRRKLKRGGGESKAFQKWLGEINSTKDGLIWINPHWELILSPKAIKVQPQVGNTSLWVVGKGEVKTPPKWHRLLSLLLVVACQNLRIRLLWKTAHSWGTGLGKIKLVLTIKPPPRWLAFILSKHAHANCLWRKVFSSLTHLKILLVTGPMRYIQWCNSGANILGVTNSSLPELKDHSIGSNSC